MEKDTKVSMTEVFNKHGMVVYLLLLLTSYLLKHVFEIFENIIPIALIILFVAWVLLVELSPNFKHPFGVDKKYVLGFLVVFPTFMVFLIFSVLMQYGDEDNILDILTNNDTILLYSYAGVSAVGYYILSMYSSIEKAHEKNSSCCKFDEQIGERILAVDQTVNGVHETVSSVDQTVNEVHETVSVVDGKLSSVEKSLGTIVDSISKKQQFAYTATCIPVKYEAESEHITVVLIKNVSHTKASWMFPGSHIDISSNTLNDEIELQKIDFTPEKILMKKVEYESGIKNITFVDINYGSIEPKSLQDYPENCYPIITPVFHYLFKVNEYASCYTKYNHRCHYDFTYVGEYDEIDEEAASYDVVEIKFELNQFDVTQRENGISYVKRMLAKDINKKINGNRKKQPKPIQDLCLDSIPEMIYNAVIFYKATKNIQ